jgi:outer membrane protein
MKKVFLIFLAGFLFVNAYSQQKWSLEECINYAYENNLQIKRQQLNVDYYNNNYNQSKFNVLPNANLGYGHSLNWGGIDQLTNLRSNQNFQSANIGLSSELNIFKGLQTLNDIRQKKYLFLQSKSDLEKTKNDIALAITNSYLQVLFAKELLEVAKSRLEVTSKQVERTKKLVDIGNLAQGEYFQIKAQEATDKSSLVNVENNLDITYLNLAQLLDLDSLQGFEILIPSNIEIEMRSQIQDVSMIYDKALGNMPQINSAEYALKSSEKQLKLAWGQISPTLVMNGQLGSYYSNQKYGENPDISSYADQLNGNFQQQLGLSIYVPLFNRLSVKNSIDNAKLGLHDAQLQLDIAKMQLYKEVQQAHADALASMEKYNASIEAAASNEEAFKYTQQKFEVGLVNSVDFSVAQSNLIKAKSDMIQSKYEYIFKLKILDFYMGNPIVL